MRSKRWTLLRYLTPFRRYSCHTCHHHFLGRPHKDGTSRVLKDVEASTLLCWTAACPHCASTDLRRTNARNLYGSGWVGLWRLLHIAAYRCNGCRKQFFALRGPAAQAAEGQAPAKP